MSQVLLITGLESLLLLSVIAVAIFLSWRKKQRKNHDFNNLTDDIKDRQPVRSSQLQRRLADYVSQKNLAEDISEQLIAAEKLFLQQFLEQQMQNNSISGFYENLTELLDSYISSILKVNGKSTSTPVKTEQTAASEQIEPKPAEQDATVVENNATEKNETPISKVQSVEPELESDKAEENSEPAPSWGDVFD